MLQCRSGKRTGAAAVKIAVDLVDEGRVTPEQAITMVCVFGGGHGGMQLVCMCVGVFAKQPQQRTTCTIVVLVCCNSSPAPPFLSLP